MALSKANRDLQTGDKKVTLNHLIHELLQNNDTTVEVDGTVPM